ncbi:MAG: hypothetical protein WKF77_08820 [Planctomycetaceae bacterium]
MRDVVFLTAFVWLVAFFPAALIAPERWTAAWNCSATQLFKLLPDTTAATFT